ncbi:hypothetical protein FHS41_008220 [Streptomyces violarus]|uniref:Pentapeptide repeat-containing protein n=1 Tax=Streptomyces violarus TaxID=67380 RepID=A0A7W5F6A0_9ACTN|nr:pentapeptide repeat-containing protein [Streptomyces violarus]MBB3081662.1 hypothetical protein [Streptomyces violarus]
MRLSMPRRRAERRGLRLWHVWIVLPLAFVTAIAIAAGVFLAGWDLLGVRELKPERRIDSKTLFDLVKLSFGVVAGAGALVALVVAYRRQRVDEDGALREATRLHTERFTAAVSQLGDDSAAVRLGGVHALAGLADDAPTLELRQTCIDVLCAYLQLPFTPDPGDAPEHQEEHNRYLALRKVRHTILRLIGDHYQRPKGKPGSWQGCHLDFTGVTIDGDLNLRSASFSGARVSFDDATFSGSTVLFDSAAFSGGRVTFNGATFSGSWVTFDDATFSGSTVLFNGATFSGGTVSFGGATFSGGTVFFYGATFSGGRVSFDNAAFSGGTVLFDDATFSGSDMAFNTAAFSGGRVTFDDATFSGGAMSFYFATFSRGTVLFNCATFSGCAVSFGGATGTPPIGLIPGDGSPLPTGLLLADAWHPTGQ